MRDKTNFIVPEGNLSWARSARSCILVHAEQIVTEGQHLGTTKLHSGHQHCRIKYATATELNDIGYNNINCLKWFKSL